MGNVHFEDRSHRLRDLPLLSTDFSNWLQLSVRAKEQIHGEQKFTGMH